MHFIIKEFIADKPLVEILKKASQSNHPVEIAFHTILLQMNHEEISEETYKKVDEAIKVGHSDEEVYLLFICFLNYFYYLKNMREKCNSTFHLLKSFEVSKYHPVIQAYYFQRCAYFYNYSNDFLKREEAISISISKMPKDSLCYTKFIINTGIMLGISGRLRDLSQEELRLLKKSAESNFAALEANLANALFTVNIKLIDKYFSILETRYTKDPFKIKVFNQAIEVLKGNFEEKNQIEGSMNDCLSYYRSLKKRDLVKAKKVFFNIHDKYLDSDLMFIFYFANYHHAFVTERYEIIEEILNNKKKQNEHYMLDLFLTRYFLIKEKKDLARVHYEQLLKNCDKYQAMGRLKFELQFAFELTAESFFELTQPLKRNISGNGRESWEDTMKIPVSNSFGLNRIVGGSKAVREVKEKIIKYSNIERPVLLIGETGAGKEIVARAMHEESIHKDKPFLAINCGALTDTLLQSELFGYEAGAFTGAVKSQKGIFEAAEDGVVFLDEFGEMSHKLQVSLLRVLENNEILKVGGTKAFSIKCRIVAATNANIDELISKKQFREDLYHRLKQFSIFIPPLRERKEDIPELINFFLNTQNKNQSQIFAKNLLLKFQEYHWPGNIRELKNEIDRIKVLCGYKPIIELEDVEIEWIKRDNMSSNMLDSPIKPSLSNISQLTKDQVHQRIFSKKLTYADVRNQQILQLFQQYKKLTRGQIAQATQVSLLTATKDLKRLCAEGAIVKRMPSPTPQSHYFELVESL